MGGNHFWKSWIKRFTSNGNVPFSVSPYLFDNSHLSENDIHQLFIKCADVKIKKHEIGDHEQTQDILLIYCEGQAETKQLNQYIIPQLNQMINEVPIIEKRLELTKIKEPQDIVSNVFSGQLVLYFLQTNQIYSIDIANPPQRTPEETNTEVSIKGPKDGFIEELQTNVALIRKRLRTNSLCYEQFTIGRRSQSKVALLYIEDIIQPKTVKEARQRLQNIDIDSLLSSSQLEEMLADSAYSLFPLLDYTSRPDYVVNCLIHGRLAIITDGSPIAVIAPANLMLLLKSPEDVYLPFYFVSFERILRLLGLIIALLLPGFWVALSTYNMEQLPFPLLATIVMSRLGLPLPAPLEALLMIGLFELFREAGARLPKAVGQTVAVVGGIIVGDAAIRAGLASTTMLVVSALTAVSTFTLVNQTLSGAVSIIRLFVLLSSSVLGMYGFILSTLAIVLYLSKLESFGVPYLAPLSPLTPKDMITALLQKPWKRINRRPEILQTNDPTRQEDS